LTKPSRPRASTQGLVLAATLIVRNEARCIGRCLESVRPWVDKIVVLDTGSTDDTVDLARRAGAEVHRMAWPGNFSVARNRALDLADADWNLVIDADEWIASGGEQLRSWCRKAKGLGAVCVHSAFEISGGAATADPVESRDWITRVLPRGVRYEGRIHEQVASSLPRATIELHLGHDGYLEAQMRAKRDRNRPLLLLDLEERPGDPYILYQLGKEAEGRDEFKAASELYRQSLAASPGAAIWLHDLVVRYLHCLGQSGEFDTAFSFVQENMQCWDGSPDFFFVLGNLALDKAIADPADALTEWIPLAVASWERCLEIGDRPSLEGSVHGRGSHLARNNLDALRSQLSGLAA
jgi:hypothetical protein